MDMIFIHADSSMTELGVIGEIAEADMQISNSTDAELIDNTWSITLRDRIWEQDPIAIGDYIYSPGTEWGGPVTFISHSTADREITLQGPTWRGLLFQRRIYPPEGEGYLILQKTDANEAIRKVIGESFGSLITPPSGSFGKTVSAQWRYQTFADGLHAALRSSGLRLNLVFDNTVATVKVSAAEVNDLSEEIEISQDYGIDFSSSIGNVEEANHCLALGQGELADRTVLEVYRVGQNYYTARPASLPEAEVRTVLLDYPNAESEADLYASAIERLQDKAPAQSISVDEITADMSVELGDIIGVRDRLTGLTALSEITQKILTIKDGRIQIDVKVG